MKKAKELKNKIEYTLWKKHMDEIVKQSRILDWDKDKLRDLLDEIKELEESLGIVAFRNWAVFNYLNPKNSIFMWMTGELDVIDNEDTFEIKIVPDDIMENNYLVNGRTISIFKNKKLVFETKYSDFSGYETLKYNPNETTWIIRLAKTFHINEVYYIFHDSGRRWLFSDGYHYSPEHLE